MLTTASKDSTSRAFFVILTIFIFSLSGCESGSKVAEKTTPQSSTKEDKKKKILKIIVDLETQEKLQSAADQGFKPWKNDVIEVAKECIIGESIGAPGECKILSEGDAGTVVRVTTKKEGSFKVTLKRLVKPDGIWTATEIEKE